MIGKHVSEAIVFFDGVCGICNKFVDFCLRKDKKNLLKFSPLQNEKFKVLSQEMGLKEIPDSIVFYDGEKTWFKSAAVLKILNKIGGIWKLSAFFFIFPEFLRDPVYDFIAANRYKWFGKKEACRIPSSAERAKFI
jgi:predicted DCC family thiol-disulfide oxidoreductase YuxK